MTKTALFISPHLDDVVFSCGGLLAVLSDAGWRTVLATVFTRSVVPAQGFALACQLDKGLSAEADYMALRRAEDLRAASILSASAVHWLDFPEAPHRGYDSAASLFGEVQASDDLAPALSAALHALVKRLSPDLILAPQGLGNHVDHQQTLRCVLDAAAGHAIAFYQDTPYVIRNPAAQALACVPKGPRRTVPTQAVMDRKIAASCAYSTQIGFQFGGEAACDAALRGLGDETLISATNIPVWESTSE